MHRRSSVFTLYVLYNAAASLGVEITLNWFELFGSVQHITVHIAVMFSQFKLVCSVQDKTSHLQALHIKLIAQEVTMCKRGAMELSHHDHFCGFCGCNWRSELLLVTIGGRFTAKSIGDPISHNGVSVKSVQFESLSLKIYSYMNWTLLLPCPPNDRKSCVK